MMQVLCLLLNFVPDCLMLLDPLQSLHDEIIGVQWSMVVVLQINCNQNGVFMIDLTADLWVILMYVTIASKQTVYIMSIRSSESCAMTFLSRIEDSITASGNVSDTSEYMFLLGFP